MDSKNIFRSSQTYFKKINWEKTNSDSEWNFIGNNTKMAQNLLDSVFMEDKLLYLVTDRHNSIQKDKVNILKGLEDIKEQINFLVWDLNFYKVIEFNKVGIYRIGKRSDGHAHSPSRLY